MGTRRIKSKRTVGGGNSVTIYTNTVQPVEMEENFLRFLFHPQEKDPCNTFIDREKRSLKEKVARAIEAQQQNIVRVVKTQKQKLAEARKAFAAGFTAGQASQIPVKE